MSAINLKLNIGGEIISPRWLSDAIKNKTKARRNKFSVNALFFTTMVKNVISKYTGVIWHLLMKNGRMTMKDITETSGKEMVYIRMAIGWMVRENRVKIFDSEGTTYIDLNHSVSDFYY